MGRLLQIPNALLFLTVVFMEVNGMLRRHSMDFACWLKRCNVSHRRGKETCAYSYVRTLWCANPYVWWVNLCFHPIPYMSEPCELKQQKTDKQQRKTENFT